MFGVVGMYANLAKVAAIAIVIAIAPPKATADQVIGAEGSDSVLGVYTRGELR